MKDIIEHVGTGLEASGDSPANETPGGKTPRTNRHGKAAAGKQEGGEPDKETGDGRVTPRKGPGSKPQNLPQMIVNQMHALITEAQKLVTDVSESTMRYKEPIICGLQAQITEFKIATQELTEHAFAGKVKLAVEVWSRLETQRVNLVEEINDLNKQVARSGGKKVPRADSTPWDASIPAAIKDMKVLSP